MICIFIGHKYRVVYREKLYRLDWLKKECSRCHKKTSDFERTKYHGIAIHRDDNGNDCGCYYERTRR